jgi:hypothetical protein
MARCSHPWSPPLWVPESETVRLATAVADGHAALLVTSVAVTMLLLLVALLLLLLVMF